MEKRKKFKEMRAEQDLPYRCSRKGYAHLEDDMKKNSSNPSSITRVDVWTQAHLKKGEDLSTTTVDKLIKIRNIKESIPSSSSSVKDDALSQLHGPERRGQIRGVGFGITPSKIRSKIRKRQ